MSDRGIPRSYRTIEPGPIVGRKIGVIADAGADLAGIGKLCTAAAARLRAAISSWPCSCRKRSGARGDGTAVLEAAGIPADSGGVVTADSVAKSFTG
jgi:hypothetical protein